MPLRTWGPVLLLATVGACVALSVRGVTIPVGASNAAARASDNGKGLQMDADTSHLADHHLWITIRLPAERGKPARTVRYDAYRQVLSHYGDPQKIPSKFTLAPAIPRSGPGV